MTSNISVSKTLSIRDCGYDEYWLQDQIFNSPGILGLGELEVTRREKRQSSGGRLDLLLKNPEDDSMYEVEIMLGPTDESHIIRTIEYWDLEKKRRPQRQHFAVLVAESITRRFFNVIQLLSLSIPIIAIQASVIEVNGQRVLHFTKVLDAYEEPEENTTPSGETYDEDAWAKKSPAIVTCARAILNVIRANLPQAELKYYKFGLTINVGRRCYFWFKQKSNEEALFCFWVDEARAEKAKRLLKKAGLLPVVKNEAFRLSLAAKTVEAYATYFQQLGLLVKEAHEGENGSGDSSKAR